MQEKLTIREAATFLGVSRTTIWTMVRNGELSVTTNPIDKRERLISRDAIEHLRGEGRETASVRRFLSDGAGSNPEGPDARNVRDWIRATWHPDQ